MQRERKLMKSYTITFMDRETLPDKLEVVATDLGISPEQLIKRLIGAAMAEFQNNKEASIPGENLRDFLVKNGVWTS